MLMKMVGGVADPTLAEDGRRTPIVVDPLANQGELPAQLSLFEIGCVRRSPQ